MTQKDAQCWNTRYSETIREKKDYSPRPFLSEHAEYLPSEGLALDIAVGLGGNASFLMSRGLRVVGVDISWVGVRASKTMFPNLLGVVADLNHFYLSEASFDVILNFYYLQRTMWADITRALRPGGLLFFETMTEQMLADNPGINPAHLLTVGELATGFPDLETLFYHELATVENGRTVLATACLIARKPD